LLLKKDDEILPVQLAGAHNRRNGTLVVKTIDYLGLGSPAATVAALEQFPGTDRRFERLADNLYSDYAHHPVEIAATLQLAREISDHVIVVYQPHQNIRQHEIRDQYGDCFDLAEQVYWLPTYLSREDQTLPILSPGDLISELADKSVAHVADLDDTLWQSIQQARQEGKLVLAMGAGSIDSWLRDQLASTPPGTHDILPL
jgi:UDP-N-acetylmuramate--alanine ligase